eukprot:131482-Pleurochrysis_carterae.AAC.1
MVVMCTALGFSTRYLLDSNLATRYGKHAVLALGDVDRAGDGHCCEHTVLEVAYPQRSRGGQEPYAAAPESAQRVVAAGVLARWTDELLVLRISEAGARGQDCGEAVGVLRRDRIGVGNAGNRRLRSRSARSLCSSSVTATVQERKVAAGKKTAIFASDPCRASIFSPH